MNENPPLAVSDEVIKILFECNTKEITITAGLTGGEWSIIGLPAWKMKQNLDLLKRIKLYKSELIDVLRESGLNNRICVPRSSKARTVLYDAQGRQIV